MINRGTVFCLMSNFELITTNFPDGWSSSRAYSLVRREEGWEMGEGGEDSSATVYLTASDTVCDTSKTGGHCLHPGNHTGSSRVMSG